MSSRVYLGALPENVSTTEVHKYLSMYGQILEIKLRQGESQEGYSPYRLDAGQQVLASCNSTARRTPWCVVPDRLFLSDFEHPAQELMDFGCSLGGEIAYCGIDTGDRTRRFVDFTLEKDAEHAVKELSGQALLGNIVQLTRYAARREETRLTQPMRSRSRSPLRNQRQPSITPPDEAESLPVCTSVLFL
ncbi:hypothetical protein VTO73DRAFT_3426 [Trametes versicolor]